ncbi:hypothetical protein EYF80_027829 [Liparis tanakae]|uniref:Uncharacterized protein n=1 Tax=Liparis tanakae TaxID=230148 RepID=A0A4Z2HAS8_9TELE|nr:hypothetical protein EYF80_027829 [Liparis tanakae]
MSAGRKSSADAGSFLVVLMALKICLLQCVMQRDPHCGHAGGRLTHRLTCYRFDHILGDFGNLFVHGHTEHLDGHPVERPAKQRYLETYSRLPLNNTLLYRRVMMYFSTWSITCSTDSEEPGRTKSNQIPLVLPSSGCYVTEIPEPTFKVTQQTVGQVLVEILNALRQLVGTQVLTKQDVNSSSGKIGGIKAVIMPRDVKVYLLARHVHDEGPALLLDLPAGLLEAFQEVRKVLGHLVGIEAGPAAD